MRFIALVVFMFVAGLNPATEAKPRKPAQEIDGEIVVGLPNCTQSAHRRLYLIAGEEVDGITGYEFDVDPKSWKGRFDLEITGATEITAADLAIYFYDDFRGVPDDVVPVRYDRMFGGEKGKVPSGATKSIVMLCQGENPHPNGPDVAIAAQVSFKYVAQAPPPRR